MSDHTPIPRAGMLRQRQLLGLTQQQVADRMGMPKSTYAAWEQGRRGITMGYRRKLAEALEVGLSDVAGWFDSSPIAPVNPTWLGHLAALEEGAAEISWYEPLTVPGLLQTDAYATAVERQAIPEPSEAEVRNWVNIRLARQAVLARAPDPPLLPVVLEEAVLRRRAGDRAVMAGQLEHLATMAALPHIDLRVLPFGRALHITQGAFTLLRSAGLRDPYMLVTIDPEGVNYSVRPESIRQHTQLFGRLQDVALSQAESIDLFRSTAQEHRS